MTKSFSQEFLNAFVDDELADVEREQALRLIETDETFKREVCERRTLKEQVRAAYALPVANVAQAASLGGRFRSRAWAALVFLAVGLGAGWIARDMQPTEKAGVGLAGLPKGYQAVTLAERVDPDKVVLHLDSGDPARLAASLEVAARLLDARGTDASIEVIVNSYGLDLLRQDGPQRVAVEALARKHANLSLVACGQTIARLRREGVTPRLIPEARVASSAIGQITSRMAQGWVYVKV